MSNVIFLDFRKKVRLAREVNTTPPVDVSPTDERLASPGGPSMSRRLKAIDKLRKAGITVETRPPVIPDEKTQVKDRLILKRSKVNLKKSEG